MRYDPHQPEPSHAGPAEMLIGFIVCCIILGFIIAQIFK